MKYLDFVPEELESIGKFMWDPDYLPIVYNFLELEDKMKVLDVGCGTGTFTRKIAYRVKEGEIIGLDIDEKLLESAKKIAKEKDLKIKYVKGNVYNLEFEDNYFDLVTCQKLLCNLDKPEDALKEMIRVSRDKVVAIEPHNSGFVEYCEDEEFLEFLRLVRKAEVKSEKSLREKNVDLSIGPKLPTMFYRNGLTDVETKGYLIINVSNERENNPTNFEIEKLKKVLTKNEIEKFNRFSKINKEPPKGSLQASPIFIVKGVKDGKKTKIS